MATCGSARRFTSRANQGGSVSTPIRMSAKVAATLLGSETPDPLRHDVVCDPAHERAEHLLPDPSNRRSQLAAARIAETRFTANDCVGLRSSVRSQHLYTCDPGWGNPQKKGDTVVSRKAYYSFARGFWAGTARDLAASQRHRLSAGWSSAGAPCLQS